MSPIESIYQATEFIESHLQEPITIADIAEAVHFSVYHFCRMFNKVVRHPPYDFLMRRRLTEAAHELRITRKKIIEIAFDYQFNSPETFSRAFKRLFQMQPNQWKRQPSLPARFGLTRLSLEYLTHINACYFLKPSLITKPALHLTGLMTLIDWNKPSQISALWPAVREKINEDHLKPEYWGILFPFETRSDQFFYFAGILSDPDQALPGNFVSKTLPEMQYAPFIHTGGAEKLPFTIDFLTHTWLPQIEMRLASPLILEKWDPDSNSSGLRKELFIPLTSENKSPLITKNIG